MKKYRELFMKVGGTLRQLELTELFDAVLEKLLRKDSCNTHEAVDEALLEKYKIS